MQNVNDKKIKANKKKVSSCNKEQRKPSRKVKNQKRCITAAHSFRFESPVRQRSGRTTSTIALIQLNKKASTLTSWEVGGTVRSKGAQPSAFPTQTAPAKTIPTKVNLSSLSDMSVALSLNIFLNIIAVMAHFVAWPIWFTAFGVSRFTFFFF